MPPIDGQLVPCQNGYHLCHESDLLKWLGPTIYEAEYRGERLDDDDKIVVREARLIRYMDTWNERTARLFLCDLAEKVLPIYESAYPSGDRPRKAIEIARRFANGNASKEELDAARDAASASANAASASARDAASASANAARDATWDATWDAAWDAAWYAASASANAAWAARDAVSASAKDAWAEQTTMLMAVLYPSA